MANRAVRIAKSATAALIILWEESFFRGWKKKGAIDDRLGKKGYHFSAPELGMALKRAKYLTRKGKHGTYEYIQKYPFVAESKVVVAKKKAQPSR